jgi:hypothetical protein
MKSRSSLAWAAIALSLSCGIAGIAHTTAVISVALKQDKPYDFGLVSLLATGGVLVYPGLINIGIIRWIRQGHPWALAMSAVVTFPLLVYEALLVPAHHSNQAFGVILCALYLCSLMIAVFHNLSNKKDMSDGMASWKGTRISS